MLFVYVNLHLISPFPLCSVHVQDCYSYIYSQHKTLCIEVQVVGLSVCSHVCL